ncbi:glycosyltransferase family 2 protein [Cobetia sp. QF-1]|uniref:glycosyltransferase family 2 protein n=1 Tax=Cobetia sp. QF-1 TaxID=1969833 RepID=UPI001595877B|nr:glycosyltransferase family 2 protein [Cobetia sp. QF-1]
MKDNDFTSNAIIRVCAIAKDEGPYLVDWICHHLYFGFDQIHIYVNRTTDNSLSILQKVSEKYPQVTYETLDWLDYCDAQVSSKLQNIAYAKDLGRALEKNVDWWLCIDIDEYWIPNDFNTSIKDFLFKNSSTSYLPICFQWHCEVGKNLPFTFLDNQHGFFIPPLVKTITPIKHVDIRNVRVHVPVYNNDITPVDANGKRIEFDETINQHTTNAMRKPKKAYIVHRMFRSEIEYTALLLRGRPSQPLSIKTNRPGYKPHNWDKINRYFDWPKDNYLGYMASRSSTIADLDVNSYIKSDVDSIKLKSEKSIELLKKLIAKGDSEAVKVADGLTIL